MANVTPCAFKWESFSDMYEVDEAGKKLSFKFVAQPQTGPPPGSMYHTAIASQSFEPDTGKYYWEFTTAQDNFKIGVALRDAPTSSEMGFDNKTWAVYIQTGECEHDRLERMKPEGVQRRLWRLVVPISGGRFGCLLDTKNGTLQLFFNGEYQGMAFDEASGIKGKTVHAAVGIAGVEDNNRAIGFGKKYCQIVDNAQVPKISSVEKKVIC
eukprot:TRINITY_DN22992_c0_g1_i1.p1 TRINITY_DN22992_c0_g1~~TRINITY_DN22992_c0_g1_i1.p1  ORF type:complete len:211 (+),score=72.34 TRINITY_DN22992_c0_g1_i1:92-724(+)